MLTQKYDTKFLQKKYMYIKHKPHLRENARTLFASSCICLTMIYGFLHVP